MTETTVAHCSIEDLMTVQGELPEDIRLALSNYLSVFAKPLDDGKCLRCGKVQGGFMAALLGGFVYGIQHGEGRCDRCGWPGRANHYVKDAAGSQILQMNCILQYHPDVVEAPTCLTCGGPLDAGTDGKNCSACESKDRAGWDAEARPAR